MNKLILIGMCILLLIPIIIVEEDKQIVQICGKPNCTLWTDDKNQRWCACESQVVEIGFHCPKVWDSRTWESYQQIKDEENEVCFIPNKSFTEEDIFYMVSHIELFKDFFLPELKNKNWLQKIFCDFQPIPEWNGKFCGRFGKFDIFDSWND